MNKLHLPTNDAKRAVRGFTLIEVVFVVVIIALLAAAALPIYRSYSARSQASELALKYDAIRTNIQVAAKAGDAQTTCASLASSVQSANLSSNYAQLAVDFEPVSGGYTPVLTMCATLAAQGPLGVEVTREAHNLLSRNSAISPGAVVGDSAVSFSVRLAGDTALCKVVTTGSTAKTGCAPTNVVVALAGNPVTVSTLAGGTGAVAKPAASAASGAASQPISQTQVVVPVVAQPVVVSTLAGGPGAIPQTGTGGQRVCPAVAPSQVNRQAMNFASAANGRVSSAGNLNTRGNLPSVTAEVVIAGQSTNAPGATLLSYTTSRPGSGFSLWNPQSLHITLAGTDYNTGFNAGDGQDHRITMSWNGTSGQLVLFDNGRQVWQQAGVNRFLPLGSNGQLTIGQDQRPVSGGLFNFRAGYSGTIVAASLANRAATAAQVSTGPLANVFPVGNGLLANVVMGPNGQPVDTTGHSSYSMAGGVSAQNALVSTSVYVDTNCR
ncbi:MAG: prepilin-type N-terminal cleavage/methylation domain-containing protein [Comamonadaceae bacterium]|nr:prepilin-type N-terminal cleavage/methylation domain-containing protein [Comamonadaceae bacterium]